jgi:hypothetical protein
MRRSHGGNASLSDNLFGSGPSQASLRQGGEFLKFHTGQHGGSGLGGVPLDSAFGGRLITSDMESAARIGGLTNAFREIGGMQDGGRRRKRRSSRRSHRSKRHTKRSHRRSRRRSRRHRGGALQFAPINTPSMLLDSGGYQRAGLNSEYQSGGLEREMATQRANM